MTIRSRLFRGEKETERRSRGGFIARNDGYA